MSKGNGLSHKQQRFVEEYLVDFNASQAALRAGYSHASAGQSGYANMKNPEIQAAVTEAIRQRQERTAIDQDWVIERLVENVNRSMTIKPVLDKDGEEIGQYVYQGNWANRALELIGKHQGMFQERQEVNHAGDVTIRIVYDGTD